MRRRSFIATSTGVLGVGSLASKIGTQPAIGVKFNIPSKLTESQVSSDNIVISLSDITISTSNISDTNSNIILDIQANTDINTTGFTSVKQYRIKLNSQNETIEFPSLSVNLGSGSNLNYSNASSAQIRLVVKHPDIGTKYTTESFIVSDNLLNELIAYYPMEKGNGEIINDAIGNNIGQIRNGANWSSGKIGSSALNLDGNQDYVDLPIGSGATAPITISFWVNKDQISSDRIIGAYDGSSAYLMELHDDNGTWRLLSYDGSNGVQANGNAVSTGVWTHIVGVIDSESAKIYENGTLTDKSTNNISPTQVNNWRIGENYYTSDLHTDAQVEEVRIYDRALSSTEIEDLYNLTEPSGQKITENDVPSKTEQGISRWKFDDSSNTGTATDSWNSNAGNIIGGNYVDGVYGSAIEFPTGTDDYIDIEKKIFQSDNNYTISVWWKEYNNNGRGGVFQREPTSSVTGEKFGFHFGRGNPDTFSWYIKDKNNESVSAQYTNLNDHIDDWVHFVGVFDKTEKSAELYRNGESVGLDKNANLDPSYLGETDHYNTRLARRESARWNGRLDDVRIYNQTLTSSQIQKLFNLGSYRIQ